MTRRKRWQPPHPDPDQERTTQRPRCRWNGCDWPTFSWLPVCYDHAEMITEVMTPRVIDSYDTVSATTRNAHRALAKKRKQDRENERTAAIVATRGDQPGWIYYLHTDGKVKIGYSADVTKRLRAYTPGFELLAVHPGTPDLEKRIHRDFDAHRVAGREWFRPADEILDHCAKVRTEHGDPKRFAPKVRDPHDSNRVVAGKRIYRPK